MSSSATFDPVSVGASASVYRLGIVGAGPTCTYVLDRLAAHLTGGQRFRLDLHVFDPTGEFGAGLVHSPSQPKTSPLNRIAGQIAFGADESNVLADTLLPAPARPDFVAWCRRRYEVTGDEQFAVKPESWPKRFLHGLALRDLFDGYIRILRSVPDVSVTLHRAAVVGLEIRPDGVHLRASGEANIEICVDHVLLVTGHTKNRILPGTQSDRLRAAAARGRQFFYVHYPYPMDRALDPLPLSGETVVGCRGMGLTAFDVVLHMTEGRGGAFTRENGGALSYRPSGREPRLILFCRSGLFTSTRPYNAKEVDIAALEHQGVFFTRSTVDRLRETRGRPIVVPGFGLQRQLDFELDVLPILLLEMRFLYYRTLFGGGFAALFRRRGAAWLQRFVEGGAAAVQDDGTEELVDEAMEMVAAAFAGASHDELSKWGTQVPPAEVLGAYATVLFGQDVGALVRARCESGERPMDGMAGLRSPWGHPLDPEAHRFVWRRLVAPLGPEKERSPEHWSGAVANHLRRDIQQARQDNLQNPTKAACDGVWRDLRQTIGHVVDHGGLTAASHRVFLEKYLPYHNRLANGAALDVMEQMLALIEAELLDVGTGPDGDVEVAEDGVFVVGPRTGARRRIDVLVEAKVHTFDVRHVDSALYAELLERGYVRPWTNPAVAGEPYVPGGVDITNDNHPVSRQGEVVRRVTLLGVPTEGRLFYQIGAARPRQDHHILNDIIRWFKGFLAGLPEACFSEKPMEAEARRRGGRPR